MSVTSEGARGIQAGTIIGQRYEVVRCLGEGSMGLVYACKHTELTGHMVAVKVLFPEVAEDKIAAARFRNEIFASYGVSHPNVVRAYEYLKDGDLIAYTMEYVNGGDLADLLADTKRLEIKVIVKILSQICAGVQAIHDAGIVHRDLKPENILITEVKDVKIADFGIARLGHGPKLTEHGGVVGTIDYVAPEYMLESKVDWRSDIYAIGILGYEMIAGTSPFRGESVYATMTMRLKTDPEPPSTHNPKSSKSLDKIILKAMSRSPESRYQSASEMFYDLQMIIPGEAATKSDAFFNVPPKADKDYVGPEVEAVLTESGEFLVEEQVSNEFLIDALVKEEKKEKEKLEASRSTGNIIQRANNVPDLMIPNIDLADSSKTVSLSSRPDVSLYDFDDDQGLVYNEPVYAEVIDIESYYLKREQVSANSVVNSTVDEDDILATLIEGKSTNSGAKSFEPISKNEPEFVAQQADEVNDLNNNPGTSILKKFVGSTFVEYFMLVVAALVGLGIAVFFLLNNFFPRWKETFL